MHLRLEDYPAAATALKRALAIDPTLVTALYHLGLALIKQGHGDQGVAELERVAAQGRAPDLVRACRALLDGRITPPAKRKTSLEQREANMRPARWPAEPPVGPRSCPTWRTHLGTPALSRLCSALEVRPGDRRGAVLVPGSRAVELDHLAGAADRKPTQVFSKTWET